MVLSLLVTRPLRKRDFEALSHISMTVFPFSASFFPQAKLPTTCTIHCTLAPLPWATLSLCLLHHLLLRSYDYFLVFQLFNIMSNPLDSLLPPDYGKERPSSSSSKDPGGGRGGARDVWGNPRNPKREELKENSSEYHRGGSSSTSTSSYRTGPGATQAQFSTPQQRAGTVQGYKREA